MPSVATPAPEPFDDKEFRRQPTDPLLRRQVLRAASRLVGRDSAEDVAQTAYTNALDNARTFDPSKGKLATWMYGIVKNCASDHRRKNPGAAEIDDDLAGGEPFGTTDADLDLKVAIDALPDHQRLVFELRHFEDLKWADIANRLGKDGATVYRWYLEAANAIYRRAYGEHEGR